MVESNINTVKKHDNSNLELPLIEDNFKHGKSIFKLYEDIYTLKKENYVIKGLNRKVFLFYYIFFCCSVYQKWE